MIKVRVGQVWDNGNDKVTLGIYRGGLLRFRNPRFESQQRMTLDAFYEKHEFIPQTDLEWLAVNVDKWDGDEYRYVWKRSEMERGFDFLIVPLSFAECYSRQQWQNMRYHLGLDKKPHYEFFNGQWSETK